MNEAEFKAQQCAIIAQDLNQVCDMVDCLFCVCVCFCIIIIIIIFVCRAENSEKQYRDTVQEKIGLQAKLKKANKKLQQVEDRIGVFKQRDDSLQNLRLEVHEADARALRSERIMADLEQERDRVLVRFATCLCECCQFNVINVCICVTVCLIDIFAFIIIFMCRAENNEKQYRDAAQEKIGLQSKLKKANERLQQVQDRIVAFKQRDDSLQNLRREVHEVDARALRSDRVMTDLEQERDRSLVRFATCLCECCQ